MAHGVCGAGGAAAPAFGFVVDAGGVAGGVTGAVAPGSCGCGTGRVGAVVEAPGTRLPV